MVSLARAVFDLVLPTEKKGARSLLQSQRENTEFRKLFERAIGNFFSAELPREDGCASMRASNITGLSALYHRAFACTFR